MNAPAAELLNTLRKHGARVSVQQGKLCVDAPVKLLTHDTKSALIAFKPDIIDLLQPSQAKQQSRSEVFRVKVDAKFIIVICPGGVTEETVMPRLHSRFGPGRVGAVSRVS